MERREKKRSANFSRREKETLLLLVEKYFNVIENKKTNAVFNKEKAECWEKLAREFNATQVTGPRIASQLRGTYEKMKQIAKKHKAEEKVEILKTGGGTFIPTLTDIDEKVLTLLKKNFFCIENNYDSNSDPALPTKTQEQPSTNKETSENFEEIVLICDGDTSAAHLTEKSLGECNVEPYLEKHNLKNKRDAPKENQTVFQENELMDIEVNLNKTALQTPIEIALKKTDITTLAPEATTRTMNRGKKRKVHTLHKTNDIERESKEAFYNKKLKLLEKKIEVMTIIEQVEKENLKTKILETEIKECVKQREQLELKIKEIEYKNLFF